jgi:hypothetical protein
LMSGLVQQCRHESDASVRIVGAEDCLVSSLSAHWRSI